MTGFVHPLDTIFNTEELTPLGVVKPSPQLPTPVIPTLPPALPAVLVDATPDAQYEADFTVVREKMLDAMNTVEHAMEELSAISQSAQDPKGFAVVGELAKSLSDLSKTLMYMHKGRGNSEPGGNSNVLTPSQVSVENAVFVGSTADLMSMRAAK